MPLSTTGRCLERVGRNGLDSSLVGKPMNNPNKEFASGQTLEDIFDQAIGIESLDERSSFLDEACKDDSHLRAQVEVLLQHHDHQDDLFDESCCWDNFIELDESGLRSFGEFEIVREIGRGGMGIVYEAHQPSLNRRVALKVLSVGADFSKNAIFRFQREAEAAARLHHTNIVPIHTTGVENHIPYYAMELVKGPSLDFVLNQLRGDSTPADARSADADSSEKPITDRSKDDVETAIISREETYNEASSSLGSGRDYFDNIARMISEVADALDHAHDEGVIHRDIKPSNLLLGPDGRVQINDFGLARIVEQPSVTGTGELMGSPRYMSPEQISDEKKVDHRTDIYALGVTLYELITLKQAFGGNERERVFSDILNTEPKSPRKIDNRIPLDLQTICQKAMEKDANRRYQSAAAFAADLRHFVNRRSIMAKRVGPLGRGLRWCKRNRSLASVSVLLVATLCLVVSAAVWESRRRQHAWELAMDNLESLIAEDQWAARIRIDTLKAEYPSKQDELLALTKQHGKEIPINSEPNGAKISVRPVSDESGQWLSLGTTPLTTYLPGDRYHVRVGMDEGEDLIVVRSVGSQSQWKFRLAGREDMVVVIHKNEYNWSRQIQWLMERQVPTLPDFLIDRREVSNADFKKFVDAKGYYQPQFWEPTIGKDWEQVVQEFTTGDGVTRGPRFWPAETYTEREKDNPVVGVSWYEAMAYSLWSQKQLPTLYHWLCSADFDGRFAKFDKDNRYNIGDRLLTHRSVYDGTRSANYNGAMDMHGNVKEWCLNEEHDRKYYAMGGSWRDEDGSGFTPVALNASDRRDDVGFRCAVYEAQPEWTAAMPIQLRELPTEPKPIPDEYVEQFRFDREKAWNSIGPEPAIFHGVDVQRVSFDAAYGDDRITCWILLPDRKFAPPYQVMLGTSPILLNEDGEPYTHHQRFLNYSPMLAGGRALVLPTLWGRTHNRPDLSSLGRSKKIAADKYSHGVAKAVKDIIRTVDFLETEYPKLTQPEQQFDMSKLIFISCGCRLSECMIVADKLVTGRNRFSGAFLCGGGIHNREQPPEVDQLTYLPHVDTPTVVLHMKSSLSSPYQYAQVGLWNLLPLPPKYKKLYSVPKGTFATSVKHIDRQVNSWFDQLDTLGKPKLREKPE